jgi:hypothetical protein
MFHPARVRTLVQSYLVVQLRERDVVLWCVTVHAQLAAITDDE